MSDQDRTPEQDTDLSEEQLDDVSGGKMKPLPFTQNPSTTPSGKSGSATGGTGYGVGSLRGGLPTPVPPSNTGAVTGNTEPVTE